MDKLRTKIQMFKLMNQMRKRKRKNKMVMNKKRKVLMKMNNKKRMRKKMVTKRKNELG